MGFRDGDIYRTVTHDFVVVIDGQVPGTPLVPVILDGRRGMLSTHSLQIHLFNIRDLDALQSEPAPHITRFLKRIASI